jgi:hypothetical protein
VVLQQEWRGLLDPGRFYDREKKQVIDLPENYFGVAARIVTMDQQRFQALLAEAEAGRQQALRVPRQRGRAASRPLIERHDQRRLLISVEGGGEILASRRASEELRRLAR